MWRISREQGGASKIPLKPGKEMQEYFHKELLSLTALKQKVEDNTTVAFLLLPGAGRRLIKKALASQAHCMTEASCSCFLQACTGTFPTQHLLAKIGLTDDPSCLFCPGTP